MSLAPLLILWSLLAASFSLLALLRLLRASDSAERQSQRPILLLRPCDAPSAHELDNLAHAHALWPGRVEQWVLSPERPPHPGLRWLRSDPEAPNRKVGHLLNALAALETEDRVVLALDADVRADRALLEALAAALEGGAALASAAPHPTAARSPAARAVQALLGFSHHSFVALTAMSAGAPTACGKALGLGPRALALLPEVSSCVGEDLELASRLHASGDAIRLVRPRAQAPLPELDWRSAKERFTRWMQVLRAHRPELAPTVPLLLAPTPLLLPLTLLASDAAALAALLLLVVCRSLLALRLAFLAQQSGVAPADLREAGWSWLLAETLLLQSFFTALARRTVCWRGRTYALSRGGRMVGPLAAHGAVPRSTT